MKARKHYWLHSFNGRLTEKLTAEDLIMHGIPRSSAYRAIKTGRLPTHRLRHLQFKVFGDLPGWEGWRIYPGKIVDPTGRIYEPRDLENLAYLQRVLWDTDLVNDLLKTG